MIIITGAAGFIASNLVAGLLAKGYKDLVLVDDFSKLEKELNYNSKQVTDRVDRNEFDKWLDNNHTPVQFIFHLGARTDTAEFDRSLLEKLNTNYSKMIWLKSVEYGLPVVYASSAATYGLGENGYSDSLSPDILKPLNPYGDSKNEFDKWALTQNNKPFFWAGLKFFNVYGPNEYHKERMASVIIHAYMQITKTGSMKLFRSHKDNIADGEQKRDFVYVKDVVDVMIFFMQNRKNSDIYNLGSGEARTFNDLVIATFKALDKQPDISYIDTPADIRDKYQYYTCADMTKLRSVGYTKEFASLEDGVYDYVKNYLVDNKYA